MRGLLALSIAAILIGGCGSDPGSDEGSTDAEKEQALRDSTFGAMTDALDRAEGVDQLQKDRKDELDAALEGSSGQ